MTPARSAKVMPRSTTSPSIWWNVGEMTGVGRVAPVAAPGHDGVDRQRVRSPPPLPSGGSGSARCACAAPPSRARPNRRRSVSHRPRAGCAGGMLSASKLYQSLSTSGPSETVKPMATKTSSSSRCVRATRLGCPDRRRPSHVLDDDVTEVQAVLEQAPRARHADSTHGGAPRGRSRRRAAPLAVARRPLYGPRAPARRRISAAPTGSSACR